MTATPTAQPESETVSGTGGAAVGQGARGTALNMAGAVISTFVSFVTVGVVTNNFGPVGAGLFFTATATYALAAQSARLGSEAGLTYFVSQLRATEQQQQIRSLVLVALGTTGAVGLAVALFGVVEARSIAGWVGGSTIQQANLDQLTVMILILAVAVPLYALTQSIFGATRGFGTMRPSVICGQIIWPLAQFVLLVIAISVSASLWPLALAWALAALIALIPSWAWLWRRLSRIKKDPEPFGMSRYWRFAGPRAVADLVSSMLERLDVIMVSVMLGDMAVGLYGTSNRLILAGQMLMVATAQSMAPHLSAAFAQRRIGDARNILQAVSTWNVVLMWPVFICLAFGAETVLRLFGQGFGDARSTVVVLSVGLLIVVAFGMGDTMLLMTGDSYVSLVNHLIALAVMVGVAYFSLPTVGLVGAAWAWVASRVVLRLLSVLRVWQTKRVHSLGAPVVLAMIVAVVAYVPLGTALYGTRGQSWPVLITHVGVGTVFYATLVRVFSARLRIDELLVNLTRRPKPTQP